MKVRILDYKWLGCLDPWTLEDGQRVSCIVSIYYIGLIWIHPTKTK